MRITIDRLRTGAAATLLLALAMTCLLAPVASAKKSAVPGMYWGAWIGSQLTGVEAPWDMSAVSRFEQNLGKGLSLVELSAPFSDCEAETCVPHPLPVDALEAIRDHGAIPVFSWGSQPNSATLEDPDFRLSAIASGAFDPYIREVAEAAKNWGHPFFLRFNWEMNGNWFLWSGRVNGNSPADFVAAWRHVHDIFTSVGADKATWVWCPYADTKGHHGALRPYYPGSAYVDWTCLDGYNWAGNDLHPTPWRSFGDLFARSYRTIVKRIAPNKPMMIGELASNGSAKAKARWIRNMFNSLPKHFPRVRGLVWFDHPDRGMNWTLESSREALRSFAAGVRRPNFRGSRYWSRRAPQYVLRVDPLAIGARITTGIKARRATRTTGLAFREMQCPQQSYRARVGGSRGKDVDTDEKKGLAVTESRAGACPPRRTRLQCPRLVGGRRRAQAGAPADLLGGADRRRGDWNASPVGHERTDRVRKLSPQGPLLGPVLGPVLRLHA